VLFAVKHFTMNVIKMNETEKLNRVTRILRTICEAMNWMQFWPQVSAFVMEHQDRLLKLYDSIQEIMRE